VLTVLILTDSSPLSPGGREGKKMMKSLSVPLFSLLSLWERRAGEVRASEGTEKR
jgi:hypothetical protein